MNDFLVFLGIFLLVDVLLVVYIFYRRSKRFSQRDLQIFRNEWQKIHSHADAKHALMDADKLLHIVLKKKGYQGSVGDQLKKAEKLFSNINEVWSAHKLRNRIAHELHIQISSGDRNHALRCFEKALKDLGAL